MINQQERHEKITRMKLQTAKVLWQEGRKDASFLLIESIDDSRGDALREQMGFSDDYEIRVVQKSEGFSRMHIGLVIMVSSVIFFFLGFIMSPDINHTTVLENTLNEDLIVSTLVVPTPDSGEILSQPLISLTMTAGSGYSTINTVATQQHNIQANIVLSRTARYDHATATENARTTQITTEN